MSKKDVVDILQLELSRRCRVNPRYSLRAFARTLGVSPANLSLVLSRKRPPSTKTLELMLNRLELEPLQRDLIAQSPFLRDPDFSENVDFEDVERVAHWISYAILSLIKTKGFKPDARWVAQRLGVTVHEIKAHLSALESVGMLEITSQGWKRKNEGIRLNNQISTTVSRSFQRQLITKALESMENDPTELRDLSSITIALSTDKIKQAKEEIRKFRLRMAELFEEPGKATEVYSLSVQLAPLTKQVNTTKGKV